MTKRVLTTPIINKENMFFRFINKPLPSNRYNKNTRHDKNRVVPENKETYFWRLIDKLKWQDKSDQICNKNTLYNLTHDECLFIAHNISLYATSLENIFDKNLFVDLDDDQKKNFLYHIIAKGSQFYNISIIEPAFCQYIFAGDECQPLYTILKDLLGNQFLSEDQLEIDIDEEDEFEDEEDYEELLLD